MKARLLITLFFYLSLIFPINSKEASQEYLNFNYPGEGMFAVYIKVLSAINLYEQGIYAGLKVDCGTKGYYYEKEYGNNWWEYYWEPVDLGVLKENMIIKNYDDEKKKINRSRVIVSSWPRNKVNKLIQKYIKIKPHILDEANLLEQNLFSSKPVIGVHYRGTDRVLFDNTRRVPYEEIANVVENEIKTNSFLDYNIFVATDEQLFLEFMLEKFPGKIIYQQSLRSINGLPVHRRHGNYDGYLLGKEALLDALLLSRCPILIRTKSSLSACASWFNPKSKVIYVR